MNSSKLYEYAGYGPGHTKWYVDGDGEIMIAKWNDKAWQSRTFVFLEEIVGQHTHRNNVVQLLNDAYAEGMKDQLELIHTALGIKK